MLPPEFTLVTIAESLLVKVSSARLKTNWVTQVSLVRMLLLSLLLESVLHKYVTVWEYEM